MYEWSDGVEIKKEFRLAIKFNRRKYRLDVYSLKDYSLYRIVGLDCLVNRYEGPAPWGDQYLGQIVQDLRLWLAGIVSYPRQRRRNRAKRKEYMLRQFRKFSKRLKSKKER